jgi:hypothetical protein
MPMTKKKLVYDCFMSWPYHEPYGMVPAPKQEKAPRKRRKSRAKPEWLRTQPGITFADELGQAKSRVKRMAMKALLKEVTT